MLVDSAAGFSLAAVSSSTSPSSSSAGTSSDSVTTMGSLAAQSTGTTASSSCSSSSSSSADESSTDTFTGSTTTTTTTARPDNTGTAASARPHLRRKRGGNTLRTVKEDSPMAVPFPQQPDISIMHPVVDDYGPEYAQVDRHHHHKEASARSASRSPRQSMMTRSYTTDSVPRSPQHHRQMVSQHAQPSSSSFPSSAVEAGSTTSASITSIRPRSHSSMHLSSAYDIKHHHHPHPTQQRSVQAPPRRSTLPYHHHQDSSPLAFDPPGPLSGPHPYPYPYMHHHHYRPSQQAIPSASTSGTAEPDNFNSSSNSRRRHSVDHLSGIPTASSKTDDALLDAANRYRKTSLGSSTLLSSLGSGSGSGEGSAASIGVGGGPGGSTFMPAPLLHSSTLPSHVPALVSLSSSNAHPTSRRTHSLVEPYKHLGHPNQHTASSSSNSNTSPTRLTAPSASLSSSSSTGVGSHSPSAGSGPNSQLHNNNNNNTHSHHQQYHAPPGTNTRYEAEREAARSNQLEAKIVLLGRQGVGKTSLVHRYMTGKFSSSLPTTIGASFLVKKLVMDGVKVRLQIWDTAGQERFRSMAPMYYRGAHAAILVYDITSEDSLADIKVWLDELRRNMSSELIVQIVGNKADAAPLHRAVDLAAARRKIERWLAEEEGVSAVPLRSVLGPGEEGRERSEGGGLLSPSRAASSLASFKLSRSNPATAARSRADTLPSNSTSPFSPFASSSSSSSTGPIQQHPHLPAFTDIGISEVSAKSDLEESIEDLFLAITSKLVERKVQIEHDRVLRSKDSIMITKDTGDRKADDTTRIWGCC